MRALRKQADMSINEMASAIGLSPTWIGQMERGEKPIEKRTALAVRQLFNERSRLYGHQRTEPRDDDVPLKRAQIIWCPDDPGLPPVKVIGIPGDDDRRYDSSYGACNDDWVCADTVGRLLRLFSRFQELTVVEGIDPKAVHRAFWVIPEYRDAVCYRA